MKKLLVVSAVSGQLLGLAGFLYCCVFDGALVNWKEAIALFILCVVIGVLAGVIFAVIAATATMKGDALALTYGISGSAWCGLIVLAIVALIIRNFYLRPGDTGGAMGVGIAFVAGIPILCIPAALLCLVGATLSGLALKRNSSPAARIGLWLSIAGPVLVALFYALGWMLLS